MRQEGLPRHGITQPPPPAPLWDGQTADDTPQPARNALSPGAALLGCGCGFVPALVGMWLLLAGTTAAVTGREAGPAASAGLICAAGLLGAAVGVRLAWSRPGRRGLLAVAVLAAVGAAVWLTRPGCFSWSNYDRIAAGMSREQVAALLGSPGQVVEHVPGWAVKRPDAPPGENGFVWGDTYVVWCPGWGCDVIYVGFSGGRVVSKWYWEHPL